MRYLVLTLILCFTHLTYANPGVFDKAAGGVVAIFGDEHFGSGAVISKNGHIITNWHVLEGQENIEVFFANDKYFDNPKKIRILKHDKERDLALIQLVHAPRNIQYISISKKLPKVGAEVHAIGHPEGELWSYAKGYVSAHRKNYSSNISEESKEKGLGVINESITNLSREIRDIEQTSMEDIYASYKNKLEEHLNSDDFFNVQL